MIHLLLIYDREAGHLVSEREFDDGKDALHARFAAEKEHPGLEVAVIGGESREQIVRTHGRYFLSLEQLAVRLVASLDR